MRKVFITTRAHFEKKQQKGGVAAIWHSFFGLKDHSRKVDVDDKNILSLIALIEGLEKLVETELQPYSLQIDADAVGLVMKFYNGSIPEDKLALYRPYLNQIRDLLPLTGINFEFKKARDHAGQAMAHKAGINAQCEVQDFSFGLDIVETPPNQNEHPLD